MLPQFDLIRALIKWVFIYEIDGYEADDILGTTAKSCNEEQHVLFVM